MGQDFAKREERASISGKASKQRSTLINACPGQVVSESGQAESPIHLADGADCFPGTKMLKFLTIYSPLLADGPSQKVD